MTSTQVASNPYCITWLLLTAEEKAMFLTLLPPWDANSVAYSLSQS